MGIFVRLHIVPDKISIDDWNSTYEQAKQLIKAYPFLDIVSDYESYDCLWNYADSPSERPIEYCNNNIGFRMIGDLITMETAESFELIKDLNYYRYDSGKEQECKDILQFYADNKDGIRVVFNSKTQGYDYHQYILAIACLFEYRLKPYALVSGDISRGQIESAIEWANNVLSEPIELSERANNEKLLARIRKITPNELAALNMFMEATLNTVDYQLGCFIRENFNKASIIKYYTQKISQFQVEMFGFSDILNEYVNLGNDLKDFCEICLNKGSNAEDISIVINKILDLGIYLSPEDNLRLEQEKVEKQHRLQSDYSHSRTPDTINSLFGKFFSIMMDGNNHQSNMYMPLDEMREMLKEKFGTICDVDKLIDEHFSKKNKKQELKHAENANRDFLTADKKSEIIERYDIEDLESLIFWKPGLTIHPELEKYILRVKEFIERDTTKSIKDALSHLEVNDKKDRMKHLITHNKYFVFSKESWDYIEQKVEDFNFFTKIAKIFLIDAAEIKINRLCLSLLNNNMLLEKYIISEQQREI